jgi:hypothetical protein
MWASDKGFLDITEALITAQANVIIQSTVSPFISQPC